MGHVIASIVINEKISPPIYAKMTNLTKSDEVLTLTPQKGQNVSADIR